MENIYDITSSRGTDCLFIQEEDINPNEAVNEKSRVGRSLEHSEHTITGAFMDQTMSIGPYLKEMDDLLKRCEELTGITESNWKESDNNKEGITIKRCSSQEYMSTKCTETHMDGSDDKTSQLQDNGFSSGAESTDDYSFLPLTSAGKKLSQSMVEYEDQLMGMLTMMGSSVEETAMDQEPQNWTTDEKYVHIPKLFKETVQTLLEPGEAMILEAHTAAMNFCDNQDNTGDEVYVRKRAIRGITQNFNSDKSSKISLTVPEKCRETDLCGDFITDQLKPQSEYTEHNSLMREDAHAKEENHINMLTDDTVVHAEVKVTCPNSTATDLETLHSKLDKCIDEVQCMEQRRRELLAEALKLSGQPEETNEQDEDMNQTDSKMLQLIRTLKKNEDLKREKSQSEIESLRQECAEEERKAWKVSVETQGLQNQLWKLKRKLFTVARECAQNQAALRARHQHVELMKKDQEDLQTEAVKLSEDRNNLQINHQQELIRLQEQLNAVTSNQMMNTQEGLSQSRKDSCEDIQQYLQDSLKALEDRYGPILIALLKRRDTAVDAYAKVKGQAQELRVQLTPLRDELQKLELQKACLEEKIKLMHFQRKEDVGQYRETVNSLEESSRELKTELKIQQKKTKEMEELKESLSKQLTFYRSAIKDSVTCEKMS